jgi:hypothetical protein
VGENQAPEAGTPDEHVAILWILAQKFRRHGPRFEEREARCQQRRAKLGKSSHYFAN